MLVLVNRSVLKIIWFKFIWMSCRVDEIWVSHVGYCTFGTSLKHSTLLVEDFPFTRQELNLKEIIRRKFTAPNTTLQLLSIFTSCFTTKRHFHGVIPWKVTAVDCQGSVNQKNPMFQNNFSEAKLGGELLNSDVNINKTYWNSLNSVIITN